MQGRLMGKRMEAHFFVEEMAHKNPIEGCNYLLALEMEMDPVPGYEIASWERGYGDFTMVPDFETMRRISLARGHGAGALRRCVNARHPRPSVTPSRCSRRRSSERALGYKADVRIPSSNSF